MSPKHHQLIQSVLEAKDYRCFLQRAFEASAKPGKKFNFAAFSRKAGFHSRGFIKEILSGRKRLTGLSFPKILKALALPPALRQYLTYLVWLEEPELNIDKLSEAQIRNKILDLQGKLRGQLQQAEISGVAADALFKSYHMLEVYSVLGNRNHGIKLSEIQKRTNLEADVCQKVLKHLITQKVIIEKNGLYSSLNPHFIFDGLGADEGFKTSYLDTLGVLKRKATHHFNSQDQLFYQSYFSVPKQRMPELKRKLRDVILEFVESSEHDDGDAVAKLLVGFYN